MLRVVVHCCWITLLLLVVPCIQGIKVQTGQVPVNVIAETGVQVEHKSDAEVDPQIVAVQGLISRWVPSYANVFQLQLITSSVDVFEIQSNGSYIALRGNTGVTIASALHYYLKYYCNCQISWTGNQLNLPSAPPAVPSLVRIPVPMTYRYYFNVCTFGYSTVWWNWQRWQQEIDWMALNGINFPLAFVGQEAVWRMVYLKLGLSDSDLLDFFTGPAFLPWQRMGNVNGWGGGLPLTWLEARTTLQQQILEQMRAFGMKPILPAFSGHVPLALQKQYPKANIVQLGGWNTFPGTYFLDPNDPLFSQIGTMFIAMQAQLFGTDHYYNADIFNELTPPTSNTTYLADASKAVFSSMYAADNQTTWVMQGWFLVNDGGFWKPPQTEAFLNAVPSGHLLMLDLWAEVAPVWNTTGQFYGHDFIWCMLHNFGGRTGIYGAIQNVASFPAETYAQAPHMVGMGLTPEAIETNVIAYDLMMEMPWRLSTNPQGLLGELDEWVKNFTVRRYGEVSSEAQLAWYLLQHNLYYCTRAQGGTTDSFIALRPQLSIPDSLKPYYDPAVVPVILEHLLNASFNSPTLAQQATYQHDVASVTRQMLTDAFLVFHENMMNSLDNNNITGFNYWSTVLLNTILDTDTVVGTQSMWLVGKWIADARAWGTTNEEKSQYEFNARNQLTLWGPATSGLHDYAYKLWGGLVHDFYYPRWNLFADSLAYAYSHSLPFNYTAFEEQVETLEYSWSLANNTYPVEPTGDAVLIGADMYKKYIVLLADAKRY